MDFYFWFSFAVLVGLPFVVFAIVIHSLERVIQKRLAERFGWKSVLWTGWLGTPIHELSHVIMCWLFRHRVDKVVFFEPDLESRRLGYVKHSWRKGNAFEELGGVFIGIAPLIGGSVALMILLWLFYPSAVSSAFDRPDGDVSLFSIVTTTISAVFSQVLKLQNIATVRFWAFIYLVLCVGSHMAPSRTDYQNAAGRGIIWLAAILLSVMSILSLLVQDSGNFISATASLLSPLLALLAIAALLCGIATTIVGLLLSFFPKRFEVR